ncbi:MerR family transcriptional regulator [Clostridium ljungdahlii]|uniref:HTH-type transcriptional activator mta n=1 Tax=Clostridium ljungdahlii (strain ATCC 55383 / DSM 13528 / PETC) TaxID=748727 RepID=D8GSR0_CLOLD|nr:MerR family transcriptional regulator [Clostridium ljungdahlii]ADK14480.1 predicted transcriptional regulator [Clostridium ljungdahlii DSM 13528]OAA88101.1 HTH-type transcriptional activator mta [Clostridium ljungdahlii DSM 13528]
MRTVKQVSNLTGISVRMLHHYDKIGLLKPTKLTEAGYRLYDDEALETLQQILFFKELDLPLKEIREIITSPHFDKMEALKNHKKLIILKRDRLNGLIELINKTLKGANTMSFKEFDMSEYYNVLEEFKKENKDRVIKNWGSIDKFDEMIETMKANEAEIAKSAIKQYGSIERYVEAAKKNLNNSVMQNIAEQYDKFKKDCLEKKHPKLEELYKKLVSDLSKAPSSKEIQQIAEEITNTAKKDYEIFKGDKGNDRWYYMSKSYLLNPEWIEDFDKKYGSGACKFIGEALKFYLKDYQPKLEKLYEKLASDLSKDPSSNEIQKIVSEIADTYKKQHKALNVDVGDNFLGTMADLYSKPAYIKVFDEKHKSGSSKFIGEALKFYCENSK